MTLQEFTTQVKNADLPPEDKAHAINGYFLSKVANTEEFKTASSEDKYHIQNGFKILMNEVSKPKSSVLDQIWSGFRESASGKLLNKATAVPLRKEVPIEERSQPLEFVREQFEKPIPPSEGIGETLGQAVGGIAGDLPMYIAGGVIAPEISAVSKAGQLGAKALHGAGTFAIPAAASTGGDIESTVHSAGLGALLPIANLPAKRIFRALAGGTMGAGYTGATGGNKDEIAANSILFGVMSAMSPQMRFKVVEEVKANPDMPIGQLPSFKRYGLEQELTEGIKREIKPEDVRGLEGAYNEKTLKPFERISPELVVEEPLPKQIAGMPERLALPEPQTKGLPPSPVTYGDNFVAMPPEIAPELKYPYAGQKRLPPATDFEVTPEGQGINIKGQEAISRIEPSQILFDNLTKPQATYQQGKRFKETGIKPEVRQNPVDGSYYVYEMKPVFKLPVEKTVVSGEPPKPQGDVTSLEIKSKGLEAKPEIPQAGEGKTQAFKEIEELDLKYQNEKDINKAVDIHSELEKKREEFYRKYPYKEDTSTTPQLTNNFALENTKFKNWEEFIKSNGEEMDSHNGFIKYKINDNQYIITTPEGGVIPREYRDAQALWLDITTDLEVAKGLSEKASPLKTKEGKAKELTGRDWFDSLSEEDRHIFIEAKINATYEYRKKFLENRQKRINEIQNILLEIQNGNKSVIDNILKERKNVKYNSDGSVTIRTAWNENSTYKTPKSAALAIAEKRLKATKRQHEGALPEYIYSSIEKQMKAKAVKGIPEGEPTIKEPLTVEQGKVLHNNEIITSEKEAREMYDANIGMIKLLGDEAITPSFTDYYAALNKQFKKPNNKSTASDIMHDLALKRGTFWEKPLTVEQGKVDNPLKSEKGGASLDLLVPESLERLANFTSKKITDAIPHLENIGKSVYRAGMKFNDFISRMKDSLGDLWNKFKGLIPRIWMGVKKWNEGLGERGSVRIWDEKSEKWTETSERVKTQDMKFDEKSVEPSPEITPKEYGFKGRTRGAWKDTLKNFIGITSTELGKIHNDIKVAARKNVLGRMRETYLDEVVAKPFLDANKKLSLDDQMRLKEASLNGWENTAIGIIGDSLNGVKALFEKTRQRAIKAGYDIQEFTGFYFPRVVGDAKGLLNALRQDKYQKEWSAIDDAIREIEAKKGGLTDVEKGIIADQMLRGYPKERITLSEPYTDPAHMKSRKIKEIPPELLKYYLDLPEALTSYIKSMNHAIKTAEFFGKGKKDINLELITDADLQKSIGDYVIKLKKEGKLKAEDEFKLRDYLQAVFKPTHANYGVQAFKNLTYIQVLGQFSPALTQIIDLALVSEKIGYKEAFKAHGKALIGKSEIKTKDIGVDKILYEFSQGGEDYIAKVLDKTLKLTGFSAIDRLGKEALLNGKLSVMRKQARSRDPKLIKELKDLDLPVEETINDLIAGKKSENILFILANTLSDLQPISELEVPKAYLKANYGKVFYMLKTYQLKLFDVYRNEVYEKIRRGTRDEKIDGIKKFATLSTALFLLGASTDQIKDFMLQRDTDFNDMMWDNFFRIGGVSKYTLWRARQMGLTKAALTMVSPPAGIIETGLKDLQSLVWEGDYDEGLQSTKYIPIGGGLYYWWFGKGRTKEIEKERKKIPDWK